MPRSKELRRIEAAIAHRHEPELRWELRKKLRTRHSNRWYRLEKAIRTALVASGPRVELQVHRVKIASSLAAGCRRLALERRRVCPLLDLDSGDLLRIDGRAE